MNANTEGQNYDYRIIVSNTYFLNLLEQISLCKGKSVCATFKHSVHTDGIPALHSVDARFNFEPRHRLS
jgi:hypothetical protein